MDKAARTKEISRLLRAKDEVDRRNAGGASRAGRSSHPDFPHVRIPYLSRYPPHFYILTLEKHQYGAPANPRDEGSA